MAIAYFSTWTTYGTWLPGDQRGWFHRGRLHEADLLQQVEAAMRMAEDALTLDAMQRALVEREIAAHCDKRGWILHAANARSNHVHVVITAPDRSIEVPREQVKAWCTRQLKQAATKEAAGRQKWWTERGWDEYIDEADHLANAINYVRNRQDGRHRR